MAGAHDVFLRSVPSDANQHDVRLYDPTVADSGGGAINGTAAQTFAAFVQSVSGRLLLAGQAAQTFGSITQTTVGNLPINAVA